MNHAFFRAAFRLVFVLLLPGAAALEAADLTATAELSRTTTTVSEPVQLLVKVTGVRRAGEPPEIAVDGVKIRYVGPSQKTEARFENGRFASETSVTYIYEVKPEKTGSFSIPPVKIEAEGRTAQTKPIALKVEAGGGARGGKDQELGFVELIIPKSTIYVGEMMPVELRLHVDSGVRWQPEAMPDFPAEGFTKQKMPEPRQEHGRKDGRELDVLVFRTAITPGKAGKLTLGPVEVPFVAQVPRARRNRPRSLFDLFDDDVFGDPLFSENRRYKARAEAVTIEVKPLPVAGRPKDFTGAVGQFKFEAQGSPAKVKVGDPVTMKLTVSGRGNFDRVEAPALVEPTGWRSYPPAASFKPEDDLALGGVKTFDVAVIPEERKSAMPQFQFSYFDPAAEKYVTRRSESVSLLVEAGALPPPPAPVAPSVKVEPQPETPPAQAPQPADILGIRYDAGDGRHSFEPLFSRREFWLAQLVPALGFLALLAARLRRSDARAAEVATLRREKSSLHAKLRQGELPETEFFASAARVIQIETALATGRATGSVDAAVARASRQLDDQTAEGIGEIFEAQAEFAYAGAGMRSGAPSAPERERVLRTIEKFHEAYATA